MVKAKARRAALKASRRFRKRRPSSVSDCPPKKKRAPQRPVRGRAASRGASVPCATYWAGIEAETEAVLARGRNAVDRNAEITKAYARLFQRRPELRWYGIAVFGSKQVGCVLRKAKSHFDRSLIDYVPLPPPLSFLQSARNARRLAATIMYKRLGDGNAAVFRDLYPLGRFYELHGMSALRRCKHARRPRVPEPLMTAFSRLDDGHTLDGAWRMVRHEQEVTLQQSVYGHEDVKWLLRANRLGLRFGGLGRRLGAMAMESVLAASCDEGPTVPFSGSDLSNVGQRREFVRDVTETFNRLYHPRSGQGREEIDRALATLREHGRPPGGD
ncbi:MAG TPA: hypothetical protein VF621_14135 [Pyrinomonadaceae bacterium]